MGCTYGHVQLGQKAVSKCPLPRSVISLSNFVEVCLQGLRTVLYELRPPAWTPANQYPLPPCQRRCTSCLLLSEGMREAASIIKSSQLYSCAQWHKTLFSTTSSVSVCENTKTKSSSPLRRFTPHLVPDLLVMKIEPREFKPSTVTMQFFIKLDMRQRQINTHD